MFRARLNLLPCLLIAHSSTTSREISCASQWPDVDICSTSSTGSVVAMFLSYRVHYSLQIFEGKLGKHEAGSQRALRNNSNIDLKSFHLCLGHTAPGTEASPELGSSQWIHCTEYWHLCQDQSWVYS